MLRLVFLWGLVAAALAGNPKQSPAVKKVIEMMEELKTKVTNEGAEEKKTYDKYKRFCDETKTEKEAEIKSGENSQATLEAKIKAKGTEEDNQADAISGDDGFEAKIAEITKDMKDAKESREADRKLYEKANAETEKSIRGLDKALDAVRSSKPASLLQQEDTLKSVREAAFLADSLGYGDSEGNTALLQVLDAPTEDYNFHSGGIIETLEKLQGEFRDADMKADEEEGKAVTAFTTAQAALQISLNTNKANLETAKEKKAAAAQAKADASKDLVQTKKDLADDKKYLAELLPMCAEKKKTFDQRVASRTEELKALGDAIKIVQDSTKPKESLLEEGTQVDTLLFEVASHSARTPEVLESAEADAEAIEDQNGIFSAPLAFWQRSRLQRSHIEFLQRTVRSHEQHAVPRGPEIAGHRKELVDFMTTSARASKSSRFIALAQRSIARASSSSESSADVFGEIKKMIRDQIDSLIKKGEESQAKKAKCDKDIGDSSIKRDGAAKSVKEFNSAMAETEARRDKSKEAVAKLTEQITTIDTEVAAATKARKEEKDENEAAIKEAQEATEALEGAVKVLSDFYGKAKKNKVELLAQSPGKDAPDAGFKNGEAEDGNQESATGILGMLEVIQSDFKRTIAEYQANEKKAAKAHTAYLGEADISKESKKTAKTFNAGIISEAEDKLSEDETALKTQTGVLKSALKELAALEEACGPGVSYEERKAAREEEMKQLKKAIKLVNGFINAQNQ
eukprot:TRINITY_DN110242_c0_g1_i1.p1 TRINITY_DN110242_c0_g1~~TRINITY_DN110242_c0_g1_i1.p1  ORF type:complete len:743 (-),score=247.25 TRINITY_DN110242_c0_g1_i1:206-2434(-)